ncbi:T-cell immunomodulatory protein-like [Hoplias malabaricus]|uniref:T-cell immunomodulatory protein n=1 Tax=Hoplias malabaricus TaxID=27720 RepID=UPI003462DEF6
MIVVFWLYPALRMRPLCFSSILSLLLLFWAKPGALGLQDVTSDLFGSENVGTVAAFGDFNSDKQTDIFIIRAQSELWIFLADLKAPYFKPKLHLTKDAFPSDVHIISSVVPGDFDGDSQMDVLLTGHPKGSDILTTSVFIFWGNNQTLDQGWRVDLNRTFKDQPLVMDFNGDMIPDIFGVVGESTEVCFLRDRKPRCEKALGAEVKIRVPHSNAFIDLNRDFTAGEWECFNASWESGVF